MFKTVLIANRGEIACRIIRTARNMGINTIAIFSDADRDSLHVSLADLAVNFGSSEPQICYLNSKKIADIASHHIADAVHPGYGFLSEDANFAELCERQRVRFIGPPASAIRSMGEKDTSKRIAESAGIPVVPGYHGGSQEIESLQSEANQIGYPILIKPVAGGGGRAIRIAHEEERFADEVYAARQDSQRIFGDDRGLIERFITNARHVEIQVVCDGMGICISLFERDCSIQRNRQKIVEESPAPDLSPTMRKQLSAAAILLAQAVDYRGVGTVEFVIDTDHEDRFYFMEMNTRLQVEHPVTEMVTGIDLVEWQLRIAWGEKLPIRQEDISLSGHAIEARIYAEDPGQNYIPASGTLERLVWPNTDTWMRIDTGFVEGDSIPIHYDPLIAKLIVGGNSRMQALMRLRKVLALTMISGVATNLDLLRAILCNDRFISGSVKTNFIEEHLDVISLSIPCNAMLAIGCLGVLDQRHANTVAQSNVSGDPNSPWHRANSWVLNGHLTEHIKFRGSGSEWDMDVVRLSDGCSVTIDGKEVVVRGSLIKGYITAEVEGVCRLVQFALNGSSLSLRWDGRLYQLEVVNELSNSLIENESSLNVRSPMAGRIAAIFVKLGDNVSVGAPLAVIEAMKMEHTVRAPSNGCVGHVHYPIGVEVEDGSNILEFFPD